MGPGGNLSLFGQLRLLVSDSKASIIQYIFLHEFAGVVISLSRG